MKSFVVVFTLAVLFTGCNPKAEIPNANAVAVPSPRATASAANVTTAAPADSTYTDLDEKACKKLKPDANDQGTIYEAECPGAGGYKVILSASDHSVALTLVDPAGKSTDLRLRDAINTAAGFTVGDKMEWRSLEKGVPSSFIVRANKLVDPDLNKRESNLLVGKLGEKPCITDVVGPSATDQNTRARELADTAKDRRCVPKMQ